MIGWAWCNHRDSYNGKREAKESESEERLYDVIKF